MLINYNLNGVVQWYNTLISQELAQEYCVDTENQTSQTIWYEDSLPELIEKSGFCQELHYTEEDGLFYESINMPETTYDDTQKIMQRLNDLELMLYELKMN